MLGTMGYTSPEQLGGERADARSDIFAFGCVLYEMLAGKSPFLKTTWSGDGDGDHERGPGAFVWDWSSDCAGLAGDRSPVFGEAASGSVLLGA